MIPWCPNPQMWWQILFTSVISRVLQRYISYTIMDARNVNSAMKSLLKAGLSPSKKFLFTYFNENPLKMMKNVFYFMLKLFSFSRYYHCTKNHISQVLEYRGPSKYHLSINFLAQKKTVYPISEKFKTRTFQYSVNIIFPSTFLLEKRPYFQSPKILKQ